MTGRKSARVALMLFTLHVFTAMATTAIAQQGDYPRRPIRLVTPVAPDGYTLFSGTDTFMRTGVLKRVP